MQRRDDDAERISTDASLLPLAEDSFNFEGKIFSDVKGSTNCKLLTNFSPSELVSLVNRMQPSWNQQRRRGPSPLLSLGDHVVLDILWLKSGDHIQRVSAMLKLKISTGQVAIERIRNVIRETMEFTWSPNNIRPSSAPSATFPHVALLIDSTTIKIDKPIGEFSESKRFWDGKNHTYGIKKEVAVQACPPHYAVFVNDGTPGSVHDYETLKDGYKRYLPYLRKTAEEKSLLANDTNNSWSALFDNGYQGPATDTPGLRRLFVPRQSASPAAEAHREHMATLRVPVEQFFG